MMMGDRLVVTRKLAVNARLLTKVVRRLPNSERFTLLYASGRLLFDRFSIEVTPATGMAMPRESKRSLRRRLNSF